MTEVHCRCGKERDDKTIDKKQSFKNMHKEMMKHINSRVKLDQERILNKIISEMVLNDEEMIVSSLLSRYTKLPLVQQDEDILQILYKYTNRRGIKNDQGKN